MKRFNIQNKGLLQFMVMISFISILFTAKAQQEPMYTQYMFNTVSVNPAYTGTRNAMNVLLLSRHQWRGIEGAPSTQNFTIHSPFNKYKMGLGMSVVSDNYGPVDNLYINFNYAYRVNLSEKLTLSLGLKAGIYNYYVNLTDRNVGDQDMAFYNNAEKVLKPNAGFGSYLYTDKFYVGLAIPKFIETNLDESQIISSSVEDLKRHYFLMAGYVFHLNPNLQFKPSFINRVTEGAPLSLDVTAQLFFKQTYWLGVTYRVEDAVSFLFDVQLTDQLMIGYSYDVTTSGLQEYSNGSHEIILSYDFDKFFKKKVKSPRYF